LIYLLEHDVSAVPACIRAAARQEVLVDWIERWLGLSPDGGDGSTEVLLVLAIVAVVVAIVARRALIGRQRAK